MVDHFELVVFGLLVAVAGLVLLSDVLEVPYPIFLVLGGLVLGFIPGVPEVELAPELVLLIFLPPLLYVSAFFSSFCATSGRTSGLSGSSQLVWWRLRRSSWPGWRTSWPSSRGRWLSCSGP